VDEKTRDCWEITRDEILRALVTCSGVIEMELPLAMVVAVLLIIFKDYSAKILLYELQKLMQAKHYSL
jgi:hypothetical protein